VLLAADGGLKPGQRHRDHHSHAWLPYIVSQRHRARCPSCCLLKQRSLRLSWKRLQLLKPHLAVTDSNQSSVHRKSGLPGWPLPAPSASGLRAGCVGSVPNRSLRRAPLTSAAKFGSFSATTKRSTWNQFRSSGVRPLPTPSLVAVSWLGFLQAQVCAYRSQAKLKRGSAWWLLAAPGPSPDQSDGEV
jgi:hypothetical protein